MARAKKNNSPFALIVFKTPKCGDPVREMSTAVDKYVYSAMQSEFIRTHFAMGEFDPVECNFCSFMTDFLKTSREAKKGVHFITVFIPSYGLSFDFTSESIPGNVAFALSGVDEKLRAIEALNKQIVMSLESTQNRLVNSSAPINDRLSTLYESRGYLYSTLMGMYRASTSWFSNLIMAEIAKKKALEKESEDGTQLTV